MRVLHLATHLNSGGITQYILRLIKPLHALGIESHVLSSGGDRANAFLDEGAHVHTLNIRTKSELNPKLYGALGDLHRIVRDERIDLLHAHTRVTQVMAGWMKRLHGTPGISTCHGFYKRRLGRILNPSWGDRVIAISQPVGDHLKNDFKVSPSRIQVIHNAIDVAALDQQLSSCETQSIKSAYGFSEKQCVIGVVARLVSDKGHTYLLKAIRTLKKQYPDLGLLIVGDGRERKNLEALTEELGLEACVHFTGTVTNIAEPLAAMDIFAFPATWREGFGLSIIEAMACSKPVVVTNIWALNSLIEDGLTGILVEPKNEDLLAKGIAKLLEDKGLRMSIGLAARRLVETRFTIDRMAREIADVYGETAPAPSGPDA